jgi:flagellar biosynthesis protein FlhA
VANASFEAVLPLCLLVVLMVMLVPLPTVLLDLLLAVNLGATLLLLLITLGTRRALELSVFPSLLLLLTLYRLSLNVATTRLILLNGDAGHIVSAFGSYVVGGQLVVGLVVFLILVIIQFMVITKGAGRISEVAARFTLDALPGKQMAIDGELNSGAIDEKEAQRRRQELSREAEFYGAMDGASKFVRGDAVAGLIITAINLVGGVIIGLTDGMSFLEAITTYSILTVGDGLISQIPALVIATAAGLLTTKASSGASLGDEISDQLLSSERTIWVGASILAMLAVMPGLPKLPFLSVSAGLLLLLGRRSAPRQSAAAAEPADERAAPSGDVDESLDEFLLSDRAVLEVGARLVPLIESRRQKGLDERVTNLRRDLSRSEGIWVPKIRVRSNLVLDAEEYRIVISGRRVAGGVLRTGMWLAIPPEGRHVAVTGEQTTEPAFGLEAVWIDAEQKRAAEQQGCTVVDPISVLITHLGEVLKRYSHELITRESLKRMLEKVHDFAPAIVDDLKPEVIRMGTLHQVVLQLAEERVPLSDLALILEAIVQHAPQCKGADEIADRVRIALGRLVCERFRDAEGNVRVLTLDPRLESRLRDSLSDGQLAIGPLPLQRLLTAITQSWKGAERRQLPLAVLCDGRLRRTLRRLLNRATPELGVISYHEVPSDLGIEPVQFLRSEEIFADDPVVAGTPDEPSTGRSVSWRTPQLSVVPA